MPTVKDILAKKSDKILRIKAEATVLEAAVEMNTHRVGCLVVTERDKVVGIFTERDILCRVVAVQKSPANTLVRDVMTAPVAVCGPDTIRAECRAVMRAKRIRHLPVVDGERLVGMISIGDILVDSEEEQKQTIHYLHEYLYGEWRED